MVTRPQPFGPMDPTVSDAWERYGEFETERAERETAFQRQGTRLTEGGIAAGLSEEEAEANARNLADDFAIGDVSNTQRALLSIAEAGGDNQAAAQYLTPQTADLIVAFPSLAQLWAKKFPRAGATTYQMAAAKHGFLDIQTARAAQAKDDRFFSFFPSPTQAALDVVETAAQGDYGDRDFIKGENGAMRYRNGVIAVTDPTTGAPSVYFPGKNQDEIAGSPGWLNKVRKEWDEGTVSKWRKKLANLGYLSDAEGGVAQDLFGIDGALAAYHRDRYLNGGEVVPVGPSAGASPTRARDVVGPAQLRQNIRGQYQRVFGRQPSQSELDSWGDFFMGELRGQLRSGKDPSMAAGEAEARFQEEFESDPKVEGFIAHEEENTELRDGLLSLAQTMNAAARL